jgi:hypothetical protein
MNDRLGDIGALADEDATENEDFENEAGGGGARVRGDIEMPECARQPTHMDHFFREVETIKDDIEFIKNAARLILEYSETAIQATTSEEETEISRQVRPLIDGTNKRAKRSKTLLGLLKEESQKLKNNGKINSSDLRYVPGAIACRAGRCAPIAIPQRDLTLAIATLYQDPREPVQYAHSQVHRRDEELPELPDQVQE